MKSEAQVHKGLARWRRAGAGTATIAVAALALATAATATAKTPVAHGSSSAVTTALTKFEAKTTSYGIPTAALKDPSKLKGKTIEYIPVSSAVPEFAQIVAPNLQKAVAAVGAKLSVCSDPEASPTEWNSCFGQAIGQKDAAIILDAAPWQVVATQIPKAEKAGIKILVADQGTPGKLQAADKIAWVFGVSGSMQTAVSDWIINDSGGKAQVLINEDTDGPSPPEFINSFALPTFKQYCSGCQTTVQTISTANINQVPSETSSDLLKNPNINYVYSEFDQFLQTTEQGVQSANDLSKVKGVSTTGLVSGLQLMKSGQYLYADASEDFPEQAWSEADLVFRMILGMKQTIPSVPLRLFTRQNVGSISLTQAAQDNGSWFGPTTFVAAYEKLWGVK